MDDKNRFGGANPHFLYAPMSEDEQDVLHRLIESNDLMVEIAGWGRVEKFRRVVAGDLRLHLDFQVVFSAPDLHIPVYYFDLELKTRAGQLLFAERKPALINGSPAMVGAGVAINFYWDIAIQMMDPGFVKSMKPSLSGLTTREGNRHLNPVDQIVFSSMRRLEERARGDNAEETKKAEEMEKVGNL